MDVENVDPYELMVVIVDNHELHARPTEFKTDDDGNVLFATHYETACPHCGNLITLQKDQLPADKRVGCPSCKRGFNQFGPAQIINPTVSSVIVKKTGQKIEQAPPCVAPVECPFMDPVEAGIFDVAGLIISEK